MSDSAAGASEPSSGPRIGLALGGGSARGLAHIVVLEALDELGVKPAVIAGTSMGSIIGALGATGVPAARIRAGFVEELSSPATFCRHFAGKMASGFSSLWSVRRPDAIDCITLLEMLLPDILHRNFASLKIPFVAVAADYYAIEPVLLDRGPLIPALAASCAVPSWARPVVLDGRVLIDGGYVNPVPFDVVKDRADVIIAVDVTGDTQPHGVAKVSTVPRSFEVRVGAAQLLFNSVTREKLKAFAPDILIRPAVSTFRSFDYFKIADILAAAEPVKEEVKRQLAQHLDGAR